MVVALEGAFQGGSIGEVSGAKMTAALDLACATTRRRTDNAVMLSKTAVLRLQEANLGLAADCRTHGLHSGTEENMPR